MSIRPYLGSNVSPISVEELYHRGLLEEGETLLALFDGMLLDDRGRRVGGLSLSDFVALTDQRLITWARGVFNDTVDGFAWKDVDVVDQENWDPFHGRVHFAFRLPPVAPRTRRITVKGSDPTTGGTGERILVNTLDYMPVDDVSAMANMIGWIGDQAVEGLTGEALLAAFLEAFPPPEQPDPMLAVPSPAESIMREEPAKRRWWQLGKKDKDQTLASADNPESLISAYESERGGNPPPRIARSVSGFPSSAMPATSDQPTIYGFSRGLRLMLEVPRRLNRVINRAQQVMDGANELMDGMQDPRVRRNAIAGLRHAIDQQQDKQGPLAPVAPMVRAVLRFSEPLDSPDSTEETASARRIQVRSAIRQRGATASTERAPEAAQSRGDDIRIETEPESPRPAVQASATVRRQISLRRTVAPAAANGSAALHNDGTDSIAQRDNAKEQDTKTTRRQISLRRREPPANGNGAHRDTNTDDSTAQEPESPPRIPIRRMVINRTGEE
ncbi:MAG: hypothetical protein MI924_07705 [Chloroflexales bacterium]|nr:hypothetical protein [Chloroflexales bacterium]